MAHGTDPFFFWGGHGPKPIQGTRMERRSARRTSWAAACCTMPPRWDVSQLCRSDAVRVCHGCAPRVPGKVGNPCGRSFGCQRFNYWGFQLVPNFFMGISLITIIVINDNPNDKPIFLEDVTHRRFPRCDIFFLKLIQRGVRLWWSSYVSPKKVSQLEWVCSINWKSDEYTHQHFQML